MRTSPPVPRILIRSHKDPFKAASAETTLAKNLIGSNTGNLVFSQAVYRLLSTKDNTLKTSGLVGRPAAQINAQYNHLVIPLANAFRSGFVETLDGLSALIEKLKIPVTVVGVGAQASIQGVYRRGDEVAPAAKRFVRAVLDHSPSIGVRGDFTREYLHALGFGDEHVKVIGCPSMFMYGPDLRVEKRVEELGPQSRIALNISPYVRAMGPVSLRHAERYPNLVYMAQNHRTLELMLYGRYPYPEKKLATLQESGVPVYLEHPLIRQDRVRFFLDPQTWFDHLAEYDFSFGTRIHGNIAALLGGTPALVLAHDSRTLELAEYHQIPCRLINELDDEVDAKDLHGEAEWDSLNKHHPANWEAFADFLGEHRLSHAYLPGRDAKRFDDALAAAELPPPVGTLMGAPPADLYAMKQRLSEVEQELRKARREGRGNRRGSTSEWERRLDRVRGVIGRWRS